MMVLLGAVVLVLIGARVGWILAHTAGIPWLAVQIGAAIAAGVGLALWHNPHG